MAAQGGDPSSLSMVVFTRSEKCSTVYNINGFPWILRVSRSERYRRKLSLVCLKSREAPVWQCHVRILYPEMFQDQFDLKSWEGSPEILLQEGQFVHVAVRIEVTGDGGQYTIYPTICGTPDAYLMFRGSHMQILVNKESLASQSRYFERFFNGGRRNMKRIKTKNDNYFLIQGATYEEFYNMLKMMYRFSGASITKENVHRMLELAFEFKFKLIRDIVVAYLLAPACPLSLSEKLLITEQYNLPLFKSVIYKQYTNRKLYELAEAPEWDQISMATIRDLVNTIYLHQGWP